MSSDVYGDYCNKHVRIGSAECANCIFNQGVISDRLPLRVICSQIW